MNRKQALSQLHTQIRACLKCQQAGYWIAPGPVVHGVHNAPIMTIGQAPGPTEAVVKRPFNAGSGRTLFKWLAEAGFDETEFRAKMYMTAVTNIMQSTWYRCPSVASSRWMIESVNDCFSSALGE